ncbi:excalibur calcium-binding domain-containing protein [Peribacillus alkalitolerans]|uniref:excalibur calcium-binding domain-containing protein n=1 Tax=Peribacillus alkalitolerans TaxID=1550385 RepID=UPI001F071AD5|nr:excalibur calcium-binding domain-containing protein [Peribacillus alkalitolerans]
MKEAFSKTRTLASTILLILATIILIVLFSLIITCIVTTWWMILLVALIFLTLWWRSKQSDRIAKIRTNTVILLLLMFMLPSIGLCFIEHVKDIYQALVTIWVFITFIRHCILSNLLHLLALLIIILYLLFNVRKKIKNKEPLKNYPALFLIVVIYFLVSVGVCVYHDMLDYTKKQDELEKIEVVKKIQEENEKEAREEQERLKREAEEKKKKAMEEAAEKKRLAEEEAKKKTEAEARKIEEAKLQAQMERERAAQEAKRKAEERKEQQQKPKAPPVNYSVDRDCSDFSHEGEATAFMKASKAEGFGDHRLDRDGDGKACDD